jgi:PTS system nitrogen regulatory IIA component
MPYRNMSIAELARHIGMDARLVKKWADKGRLPGQMVGGEWRFNRAAMLEWLQHEMHSFDEEHIRNLERAMRIGHEDRLIEAYLATEGVEMNLAAKTKKSVLRELVKLAERTGQVYDPVQIHEALLEREEMVSTALPRGIALPHPRRVLEYATAEPLLCLARVPHGVPFGASDGGLTYIFVLVCVDSERLHLGLLARLAMMFNSDLPSELRAMDDAEEALALMIDTEVRLLEKERRS